jgi:adenosylhomocysteine nucleosidase
MAHKKFCAAFAGMLAMLTLLGWGCVNRTPAIRKVVLISADAEWTVVKKVVPSERIETSPWGEFFMKSIPVGGSDEAIIFFHGGWGKVAAAGSVQYCIDRWDPEYIVNLGTCGGVEGKIKKFETVLVNKTIIYDITEAMGDARQAIDDYSTSLDLTWLKPPYPGPVTKTLMVSADRDLVPREIRGLDSIYQAVAGDWETGAIAYTCARNKKKVLILRGVTDLVSPRGGEAYQHAEVFVDGTDTVMKKLLNDLPLWLEKCR